MKIGNMEVPRTLFIVSAATAAALTFGVVKIALTPADPSGPEKKAALESAKISALQLPNAAQCYDQISAVQQKTAPLAIAKTCKCLVVEVAKFAPGIQPGLNNLVSIGLKASARTNTAADRAAFIKEAVLEDDELNKLDSQQAQVLQSGIKHVMKSCPMPSTQRSANLKN